METKHRKIEDVLQDLGRKIDRMIADSRLSKIDWQQEIDQSVAEVKKNIVTLENSAKEVLGDKERWKEVENSIRTATNEFCDAIETAFRMKKH
ncbi:MAG: hypothetical protein E2O88_11830 [Bacteroidetes bacterium]|nr:MAG: hypothetical protein E2O88_11830 [Bacteroidota bacterium]